MSDKVNYKYVYGKLAAEATPQEIALNELECAQKKFEKNNEAQKTTQHNIDRYFLAAAVAQENNVISEQNFLETTNVILNADSSKLDRESQNAAQKSKLLINDILNPAPEKTIDAKSKKSSYVDEIKKTLAENPNAAGVGAVTSKLYLDFVENKINSHIANQGINHLKHTNLPCPIARNLRDKFLHSDYKHFHETIAYMTNPEGSAKLRFIAEKKLEKRNLNQ